MAPAICRSNISPRSLPSTRVVRSFSVDDLGCHATRYLPLWYFMYFTTPLTGLRFTCTFTGDINIDTCRRVSLKYSGSYVSSITTTFPSAGQMILFSPCTKLRDGRRKKATTQNHTRNNRNVMTAVTQ